MSTPSSMPSGYDSAQPPGGSTHTVPRIDVAPLLGGGDIADVAAQIDSACRHDGFFTIVGHGIERDLPDRLEAAARAFFALDESAKARVAMAHGGRAWRGWFPVGGELTAGVADVKEGLYFGTDLDPVDPRVQAGRLLHGPNLWPVDPPELRGYVEAWMNAMRELAGRLFEAIARGLGLARDWFEQYLTTDPTELFRIFRYPPASVLQARDTPGSTEPPSRSGDHADPIRWGVAEHTDYGLLTILAQDDHGGLQVRRGTDWISVPCEPGALVCNIGDMLDRMTGGRYRSTPHRVLASTDSDRISFPYFFDPGWDAEVRVIRLDGPEPDDDAAHRWDHTSLRDLSGTYGDYLSAKVLNVFPGLTSEPT